MKPAVFHTKAYCFLENEWLKLPMHNDEYNADPLDADMELCIF